MKDPASHFPKTMRYLEEKVHGPAKELKRKQITKGIAAAHAELVRMSADLFSAPKIFLLLDDPNRGAPFCRALVLFLKDDGVTLEGDWGLYNPANEEESAYRKILNNSTNVTQQFRLTGFLQQDLPVVRD